jgi:hypothetical protein
VMNQPKFTYQPKKVGSSPPPPPRCASLNRARAQSASRSAIARTHAVPSRSPSSSRSQRWCLTTVPLAR